jgi:hypothetical protein
MRNGVYLYFGHTMRTNGSFEDLQRLGITPEEGMALTFYDLYGDEQNRPTYLCADGVLYREDDRWHARIDENTFRSIPRVEIGSTPI